MQGSMGVMRKTVAFNLLILLSIAAALVLGLYFFNIWFELRWIEVWDYELGIPLHYKFFFEGIFSLSFGIILLLGAGGLNAWTIQAILTISVADWVYKRESNEDRVRPSEILYADRRRPRKIFPLAALVFIIAGVTMILIYFMNFLSS
jgi:hypothetical protein